MAYDITQPVGKIRFLLSDVAEPYVFTDSELGACLEMARGSNVKRAAALAIDANATNEILASKVLKTPNVETDGAKVADAMRKHAASLRAEADADDADAADAADEGFFDIVDFDTSPSRTERTQYPYVGY